MKLISIVFSFRNEEKNLHELVKRVRETCEKIDNWNYELIFVNDNSPLYVGCNVLEYIHTTTKNKIHVKTRILIILEKSFILIILIFG